MPSNRLITFVFLALAVASLYLQWRSYQKEKAS